MRRAVLAAAVAVLAATTAFAQPRGPAQKMFPFNMNYTLERMNGKPLPAGIRPTLVVSNELRGSGHSGCNRYSATTYPGYNGQMRVGPVALTRMACPGPAMAVESAYLRIYYSARRWREAGDVLTIQGGLGTLVFRRGI